MAKERSATPEKQLLRLIEDPKAGESGNLKKSKIKRDRRGLFSISGWISRFSYLSDKLKRWFKSGEFTALDIKIANRVLIIAVVGLFVYLVFTIPASVAQLNRIPDLGLETVEERADLASEETGSMKVASFYIERVKERNIFDFGRPKKEVVPEEVKDDSKLPSQRTLEVISRFKLVGISWSEDPDAMIEDTQALRTFFVNRGDHIGEVKVQAIFKDKVVLNVEGEEVELK